jgi:ubiquinone/menaquinone biosynthesis C-methylase UbiE
MGHVSITGLFHRAADDAPATPLRISDELTERSRFVWKAGDYDRISAGFRHEARAFVDRLALAKGQLVLDAACGSGNLAIPAAQTGARVSAFDLVPAMLDATARWAARERLDIALDLGTVEEMPYDSMRFDVVMSMFGVMFAARPDRVVAELARVTRPGGRVALANWTPHGFVGELFSIHRAYATAASPVPSPMLWGDESVIRERFDERRWRVSTTRRTLTFLYPMSAAGVAELFRTSYGPTVRALEALAPDRREQLAADLAAHWVRNARSDRAIAERTEVDSEYLEVIAIRR